MPSCAIKNCKNTLSNTKKRKISFFSFPKTPEIIEKWKTVCKENVDPKNEIETHLMPVAAQCSSTTHSDTIAPLSCLQENLSSIASGVSNSATATNSEDTCKKMPTNQDRDKEIQTMKKKIAELLKEVQSLERQLALRDERHEKEFKQRLILQSNQVFKENKTIPFTSYNISTLRKWIAKFNMDEGLLKDVLLIMNAKGTGMSDMERVTARSHGTVF
ncbi:hypothetical protein ALC60_11198 [Trachymyrmex zeteki]|uniref:THAP-type domain-containing protein n=1 Tax=Mycetomoellerius zeteki TaxID=64791 RepID=A0A151WPK3_9HYME|nr:hypothetical protein ALC60_11198 [Trachymyrmex zeteki]